MTPDTVPRSKVSVCLQVPGQAGRPAVWTPMLLRACVGSYGILNTRIATLWSWKAEYRKAGPGVG